MSSLPGFIMFISSLFDRSINPTKSVRIAISIRIHLEIWTFLFICLWFHPDRAQPGVCVCVCSHTHQAGCALAVWQKWAVWVAPSLWCLTLYPSHCTGFPVPPLDNCVLLCLHLYLIVWPSLWEMMNAQFDARRLFSHPSTAGDAALRSHAARFTWHIGWCCSSGQGANRNMEQLRCLYNTGPENKRDCEEKSLTDGIHKTAQFWFLAGCSRWGDNQVTHEEALATDAGGSCLSVRSQYKKINK